MIDCYEQGWHSFALEERMSLKDFDINEKFTPNPAAISREKSIVSRRHLSFRQH